MFQSVFSFGVRCLTLCVFFLFHCCKTTYCAGCVERAGVFVNKAAEPVRKVRPRRRQRIMDQKRRIGHVQIFIKHIIRAQKNRMVPLRAPVPNLLPGTNLCLRQRTFDDNRLDASVREQIARLLQLLFSVAHNYALIVVVFVVGENIDEGALFQLGIQKMHLYVHPAVDGSLQVGADADQRR